MSGSKILTYYKEAVDLLNGEICTPRMAILYPVYGCNLSCPGCLCGQHNTEKMFMDMDKFEKFTMQLKENGIRSIELCGGGEPLMHPKIKDMIVWITNKLHMSLGIMTNGLKLDDELNYIIITKASYIRLSLYNQTFETGVRKIKQLVEMKEIYGSSIKVGAKLLVSKLNYHHIIEQCKWLLDAGPDLISLKAERNSPYEVGSEDILLLENSIKDLGSPIIDVALRKSSINCKCWLSPIHTLVDPRGDMYICCYYMDRDESHKIGNVFEEGFSKIWGSAEHQEKLKKIDINQCNIYDCRWHGYNNKMKMLFETNTIQHEFC